MGWLFVPAFAAALAVAIGVWIWRNPAFRRQRGLAKTMSREQRRRIQRALRRGEPVSDPREARLAVQWGENVQGMRLHRLLWVSRALELGLAASVLIGAVLTRSWAAFASLLFPLAALFVVRWTIGRLAQRIDISLEKNRALAEQFAGTSGTPDSY